MDRFIGIFKRHPVWIIGAVIGVIVLIWLMSSGSSSGTSTIVAMGPSDQTVAANAAVEMARLDNQKAGALAQREVEMATIQAGTYEKYFSTTKEIAENTNLTQEHLASIVTGATTSQTQIQADTMRDLATIDKNRQTDLANINVALEKEKIAGQVASAEAAAKAADAAGRWNYLNTQDTLAKQINASSNWYFWNPDALGALFGQQKTTVNVNNPPQNSNNTYVSSGA